jgi:hypothetical protein
MEEAVHCTLMGGRELSSLMHQGREKRSAMIELFENIGTNFV